MKRLMHVPCDVDKQSNGEGFHEIRVLLSVG